MQLINALCFVSFSKSYVVGGRYIVQSQEIIFSLQFKNTFLAPITNNCTVTIIAIVYNYLIVTVQRVRFRHAYNAE